MFNIYIYIYVPLLYMYIHTHTYIYTKIYTYAILAGHTSRAGSIPTPTPVGLPCSHKGRKSRDVAQGRATHAPVLSSPKRCQWDLQLRLDISLTIW